MNFTKSVAQENYTKEVGLTSGFPTLNAGTTIAPVCDVRQRFSTIVLSAISSTTATVEFMTTANTPDKIFYLTSASISVDKDVVCDGTDFYIDVRVNGALSPILGLATLTLVAQQQQLSISFPYPIACDKNTAIRLVGSFTAGTCRKRACISGFYA